jgi:hypothetical protein
MWRRKKSLGKPEQGYQHREHRSKRSIKGLNVPWKRNARLDRLRKKQKEEKKIRNALKKIKNTSIITAIRLSRI